MSVTLIDAIRAFCMADVTIKAAVGGNRDANNTPYGKWNPEVYNYPYATMFQIGGSVDYTFGNRGSPYLEPVDMQFTFWDSNETSPDGTTPESRIGKNVDYFTQLLNGQVLSLTNSNNLTCTMISPPGQPQYVGSDNPNKVNLASWMSAVVFRFTQQRIVGVVE